MKHVTKTGLSCGRWLTLPITPLHSSCLFFNQLKINRYLCKYLACLKFFEASKMFHLTKERRKKSWPYICFVSTPGVSVQSTRVTGISF